MASITHGLKKRMSKATTRTKTINKNISAEYTVAKNLLNRQRTAVEGALKHIGSAKDSWLAVHKAESEFSEHILTETEVDSPIYAAVNGAAVQVRECQTEISAAETADAPVTKIMSKIKAFVAEVEAVEKDFKDVETSYTEVARYQKKVDKLNNKSKKEEKVKNNLDKLAGSRAVYQNKVDGCVNKMGMTSSKFDTVLKMIMAVFWGTQGKYLAVVSNHTKEVRTTAVTDLGIMVDTDMSTIGKAASKEVKTITEAPAETPAITATATEDKVEKTEVKEATTA